MADSFEYGGGSEGICYALRVASASATGYGGADRDPSVPFLFPNHRGMDKYAPEDLVVLPGDVTAEDEEEDGGRMFHYDKHGKTCFSAQEASAASEHIAAMELDVRVQECLQRKQFDLPQESAHVQAEFCNESVYGTLNLLAVHGVVRLDPNDRWTFERAAAAELAAAEATATAAAEVAATAGEGGEAGGGGGGDNRPACPHGIKCNRKNGQHFEELKHPDAHPRAQAAATVPPRAATFDAWPSRAQQQQSKFVAYSAGQHDY
jgi:hypothetical protein